MKSFLRRMDQRRWLVGVLLLAMIGIAGERVPAQQANLPPEVIAYADLVLYNGKVLIADDNFATAEAVAIRDGKFLAVGTADRILPMAGPKTRKIDLKGRTAMPGILDLHQHPFVYGMKAYWVVKNNVPWEGRLPGMTEMEKALGVAWSDANMALRDIERAVKAAQPGELVVIPEAFGRGINICEAAKLAEIDAVSPNNPVIFLGTVNLAAYAMNSRAPSLLNLRPGAPIFREEGSACLAERVGRFSEVVKAVSDYLYWRIPLEEQMPAFRLATRRASQYGITLAKEHGPLALLTGIRELWARRELTVRLRMPYPLYPEGGEFDVVVPKSEAENLFKRIGNLSGIGDDMWRFVGMRPQGVGGNTQMGGAWTVEPKVRELPGRPSNPYGGRPGEGKGDEAFSGREALVQAIRYGWDVSADHTVGDRAVAEVLKAIEEGLKTQLVKRPNQLLTMNHTPMARLEQIQKMKELGIRTSIGPWHVFWDPAIDATIYQYGEGVQKMVPIQSYIKLGLKPALEGDTFYNPPFWRMEKAITRKDDKGRVVNAAEKVTRQEALWMSTNWPAYHLGEEKKLGTVEPGKLADLIVLDGAYLTVPEDEISEIRVLMTVVGGKVVYESGGTFQ